MADEGNFIKMKLNPEHRDTMDQMVASCGMKDKADLINHALTHFAYCVEQLKLGFEIGIVDRKNDSYKIMHMPGVGIPPIARNANKPFLRLVPPPTETE